MQHFNKIYYTVYGTWKIHLWIQMQPTNYAEIIHIEFHGNLTNCLRPYVKKALSWIDMVEDQNATWHQLQVLTVLPARNQLSTTP
jgi:hypothetical protein